MDYSTFDTHTQHTRLCSNNVYLICVIIHVQMWCVCSKCLLIKPKNIFECFICFSQWFCTFMFLVFIQHAFLCFSSKTDSEVVLQEARDLKLPAKCAWGKSKVIFFIRNSHYCIAGISRLTSSREMVFRQKLIFSQNHTETFTTVSHLICN